MASLPVCKPTSFFLATHGDRGGRPPAPSSTFTNKLAKVLTGSPVIPRPQTCQPRFSRTGGRPYWRFSVWKDPSAEKVWVATSAAPGRPPLQNRPPLTWRASRRHASAWDEHSTKGLSSKTRIKSSSRLLTEAGAQGQGRRSKPNWDCRAETCVFAL